jgi:hypothetical protein
MKHRHNFHPHEPQNSWEVSYILSIFRPKLDIGIKQSHLFFTIGADRCRVLREWAEQFFGPKWVKEHTLPQRVRI